MRKRYIASFIIVLIIASATILVLFLRRDNLFQNSPKKGSISQSEINVKCDGTNSICVEENGTVVEKSPSDVEAIKNVTDCEDRECNQIYAANTRAAISAIRNYVGVKNLNLTPIVTDGVPIYITYYCSDDKRCWAVDHRTHAVIEAK